VVISWHSSSLQYSALTFKREQVVKYRLLTPPLTELRFARGGTSEIEKGKKFSVGDGEERIEVRFRPCFRKRREKSWLNVEASSFLILKVFGISQHTCRKVALAASLTYNVPVLGLFLQKQLKNGNPSVRMFLMLPPKEVR